MDMMERINAYWSRRAEEFSDNRRKDLQGGLRQVWTEILKAYLPEKENIRALDLGTGAGFFAFQLADLGCDVIGIDYSEAMISHAIQNGRDLRYDGVRFCRMDAQELKFEDESFDFIFTRNVTWTLPDPEKAYAEMSRVLAPGGRLLNGDANYGAGFRKADADGLTEKLHREITDSKYEHPAKGLTMIRERNAIADQLYVSDQRRPQWDVDVLLRHGISRISIDMKIAERVYPDMQSAEKIADYTNRFFLILGEKG